MIGRYGFMLSFLLLTSCTMGRDPWTAEYQHQSYPSRTYTLQSYGSYEYSDVHVQSHSVNEPDSYYVGMTQSPTSHKEQDRAWVKDQNPQGYTIEIADSEKPAQVASRLYKAPKTDRMAEIRYQHQGKAFYKGVYGSYSTAEEAQKALQSLPEELRRDAGIKNWGSIQNTVP